MGFAMIYTLPVRVYYEDTDMAGIVYYANYLKFIERGRSEWVREIGLDQLRMKEDGVVFAVRRVEADYTGSAKLDDLLTVETEVANVTAARLIMEQRVKRGEDVLFHAMVTVVCMNEAGQPVRLPGEVRKLVH
ncbi:acyl-CoA thioester hydrolase [Shimia abyssi]|uniref:Acyl-CoA thioester hydrolase n=2 Tax=Shimia abyssi TaxID=1662395 RepID=A0A2P8FE36_9RHOB|nr:acyl-CoA thioester hydrolase [Shimia abyssi]